MKIIRKTTNDLLVLFRSRIKNTPKVSNHNGNYCDTGVQSDYYCDENGWFI